MDCQATTYSLREMQRRLKVYDDKEFFVPKNFGQPNLETLSRAERVRLFERAISRYAVYSGIFLRILKAGNGVMFFGILRGVLSIRFGELVSFIVIFSCTCVDMLLVLSI